MSVRFNHVLLAAHDRRKSATVFAHLFDLSAPTFWGPFAIVRLDEEAHVLFAEPGLETIQMLHLAFLVDDGAFDAVYRRIVEGQIEHWADPQMSRQGQINTNHGGRGVYFKDPAGHGLEIMTRPDAWVAAQP